MKFAYLNKSDVNILIQCWGIKSPFFILETTDKTRVDQYVPEAKAKST